MNPYHVKNYYYLFVLSSFIKKRVGGSGGRVQGEDAGYKMSKESGEEVGLGSGQTIILICQDKTAGTLYRFGGSSLRLTRIINKVNGCQSTAKKHDT